MGPKKHALKGQPRRVVPSAALTSTAPTSEMPLPFKLDLHGDVVESLESWLPTGLAPALVHLCAKRAKILQWGSYLGVEILMRSTA